MAKAWAKIVVRDHPDTYPEFKDSGDLYVELSTDLGHFELAHFAYYGRSTPRRSESMRFAKASARAWSRRLGNIPVEVEE